MAAIDDDDDGVIDGDDRTGGVDDPEVGLKLDRLSGSSTIPLPDGDDCPGSEETELFLDTLGVDVLGLVVVATRGQPLLVVLVPVLGDEPVDDNVLGLDPETTTFGLVDVFVGVPLPDDVRRCPLVDDDGPDDVISVSSVIFVVDDVVDDSCGASFTEDGVDGSSSAITSPSPSSSSSSSSSSSAILTDGVGCCRWTEEDIPLLVDGPCPVLVRSGLDTLSEESMTSEIMSDGDASSPRSSLSASKLSIGIIGGGLLMAKWSPDPDSTGDDGVDVGSSGPSSPPVDGPRCPDDVLGPMASPLERTFVSVFVSDESQSPEDFSSAADDEEEDDVIDDDVNWRRSQSRLPMTAPDDDAIDDSCFQLLPPLPLLP